jgi:SEC-C motif
LRAPAFCDSCGTIFQSAFEINAQHTTFINCGSGPCPKCGGSGHIPDGIYNFIGNTIELLSGPSRTVSELQRLAEILNQARNRKKSIEEVSERIEKELPWFSSLKDLLPKSRTEFYPFIGIVIAVVGLIIGQLKQDQPPKVTVNQVVNIICQEPAIHSHQQTVTTTTKVKAKKKVGRNDPCPCGSGKKYKKCCQG